MTLRKVTRMNEGARLDAGDDLAEQLAQMKIAQDKLRSKIGGTVAEGSAAAAQMKQQDDKKEYDTESDDQELSEQLDTLVLGNPNPEKKKRRKRGGKKKKSAEQKSAEQKSAEQKSAEQKSAEQKSAEQKSAEQKSAEQKSAEQKSAEQKSAEQKSAEQKTVEQKTVDEKTAHEKEIVEMAQKMADDIVKKMGVLNLYKDPNSTTTTQKEAEILETASREMPTKQTLPAEKTPTKGKKRMNTEKLIEDWNNYFGEGELEDWRRLCRDLGLPDDLPSKTKCREAVKGVHVNIRQFLDAQRKPEDIIFFKNVWKLASWTAQTRLRVHLNAIPRGTPLRSLMRELSRY